uniref:FLZ-type domain-containing protein n=1 Tax=Davidia involucrata TaxID=16924 RepID=A0A5B7BDG6_DAVIN
MEKRTAITQKTPISLSLSLSSTMHLPMSRSPINLEEEKGEESKKKSAFVGHAIASSSYNKSSASVAVGLRILIQLSKGESNSVVKPALKLSKPTFRRNQIPASSHEYCFLKSCHLCSKNLSPDKDVYMYRGDQGFCSIECRSRQIYIDEMREIETSTKKMVASFRHCHPNGRRETHALLEEFQHRHKPLS